MSGRTDSGTEPAIDTGSAKDAEPTVGAAQGLTGQVTEARRARWLATGTGVLLTLAGLAASLFKLTASAPARVCAAYALGAAVCALAALLGARGRTRRALWLMIVGAMVMALGDQSD
ncbi:hypothetical protein [Streptomyces broussonetiae]|uniref:Uncharacterized protein n=1 Tax=Streptomyces broussonetiae TaxID=2686304 RepID=A0A6I6N2U0_9ACTN|nr:hypothetical protein [Streptomyces broussonetiae]QHA07003.1 hypothetical protein GQF42_30205 [Streptomyces broussonetiae]